MLLVATSASCAQAALDNNLHLFMQGDAVGGLRNTVCVCVGARAA